MAAGAADALPSMNSQSIKLFDVLQKAMTSLGEGAADLGLVELVMVGQESAGKSSVLGAMSRIKLPVGSRKATRSPIRISMLSEGEHCHLKLPGQAPEPLDKNGLDVSTYRRALKTVAGGQDFDLDLDKVTDREVTVEVGRKGEPPLSILDLPGLMINGESPYKDDIDQLVSDVLNSREESTLLPILICKASENINNILAHLVRGRSFVTVMTFATHLRHSSGAQEGQLDMDMYESMMETKKSLEDQGCKGLFLVSVPEGKDAESSWYKELCYSSQLDQEKKTELLKMCGIPALSNALHEFQFHHLLQHLFNVESKLKAKLQEISPCLKIFDMNSTILQQDFCERLQQVQMAVKAAVDEEKVYLPACGDQKDIPLHQQVTAIIDVFSEESLRHVLKFTKQRWGSSTASELASTTLTENWQTQALNASACKWEILGDDFFGKALGELQQCLKQQILTCFQACAQQWQGARARFEEFLDKYIDAKYKVLSHEALMMQKEGPLMKLSINVPFVHFLLAKDQTLAARLNVDYLNESLQSFHQDAGDHRGGFCSMTLDGQYADFSEQWTRTQQSSFVLVFLSVSGMLEHLVGRMMTVLFYRTFHIIHTTVTETDTSMANLTLEKAFMRHCADQGEDFSFQSWLSPGLEAMKEQHEILDKALKLLREFDGYKVTARSLNKSRITRRAHAARTGSPGRERGAVSSQRGQQTSPAPAPRTPQRLVNNAPYPSLRSEDSQRFPQAGALPGGISAGPSRANNPPFVPEQHPMAQSLRQGAQQIIRAEGPALIREGIRQGYQVLSDVVQGSGVQSSDY